VDHFKALGESGLLSRWDRTPSAAEVWLAQQAACDPWQARVTVKASRALAGVKALKLEPA